MENRVVRSVRPRTMRPDREPARSTNPNRFNFNSNNGTNAILVAIDFVDLKLDTGAFDSAENVDFIDLNKVTRGPIINPDDLWDPPFHRVADSIDLIEFSSDNGADCTDVDFIEISSDKDKAAADLATDVNSIDVNSKNDSPTPDNNANGFETSSSTDLINMWSGDGGAHARYKKVIGMRPTIDLINLWPDTNILPVNMDLVDFTMYSRIMCYAYSDIEPSMSSMGSIGTFNPNVDNGRIGLYSRRMNSWSEHTHSGYRSINSIESFPEFKLGSATSSPLDTAYTTKSSWGPEASVPLLAMSTSESEDGSSMDTVYTNSGLGAGIGISDSSAILEAAEWGEDFNSTVSSVAPDTVNSWSFAFAEGLIARLEALERESGW
ncbi:hypothetical protein N7537_002338 [Penicillium hordei]|uniref:Uncharacterized protein n=1 Tax=Penicillium hordei TaxID=40994 RepID=A0AAD6EH50_9EURO|nr:uncharacterized protein N7537_002338 [Penicillium hordei]KAJ5617224.1 hypothetical protein N7537_002338 [Penicillium hordei]